MFEAEIVRSLETPGRQLIADRVFDELHRQVLSLDLKPGARLSEVDVARALGVSRQPVRDAFYRLSKLGFLLIRPQRATRVSHISEEAVMQARFIRSALEAETVRIATEKLTASDIAALEDLLGEQEVCVKARDPIGFHELDDRFHREICERSGLGFAWELIKENKSHMDRVRFLSLAFASQDAFGDHLKIMDAIRGRDPDAAMKAMREHLSRIQLQIVRIRAEHPAYFTGAEADA